jgi:CBS domain-containing protein
MSPVVSDIMETDVETIGPDRTMETVGIRLYEAGVGSLIVRSEEGVPIGIVTTQDLLEAIAAANRDLSEVIVSEFMSRPLQTIGRDRPVRTAVRKMNEEGVEQLAIVEEFEVVGILAEADVVGSYEALIKAAHRSERERSP